MNPIPILLAVIPVAAPLTPGDYTRTLQHAG